MLNMEGWTRMEVEAATKKTIRAKDEAIKSRDQKISRLKRTLPTRRNAGHKLERTSGGSEANETDTRRE